MKICAKITIIVEENREPYYFIIIYKCKEVPVSLLAFKYATRSVIFGNQTVTDKNFSIKGSAFFIIFKNSPKFDYREFVSTIYAKREFDPSSLTSI